MTMNSTEELHQQKIFHEEAQWLERLKKKAAKRMQELDQYYKSHPKSLEGALRMKAVRDKRR